MTATGEPSRQMLDGRIEDGASTPTASPRIAYIPALDGLRGVAVIAVFVYHAGHLKGGYLGVDLFFVLSGFLITSLLLAEGATTGGIGLVRFWGRRARRLLPALGLTLIGVGVYARFVAFPSELQRIRWDGVATLAYVANWREVFTTVDYESLFLAPSPLNHTWSLAIEEQFYLVWPLVFVGLVALASRRGLSRHRLATATLVVSLGLGAASLGTGLVLGVSGDWNRVYFGTDTRAVALLIGAALAAATARFGVAPQGRPRRMLEAFGAIGVVTLTAAWFLLPDGSWFLRHGGLALCSVAAMLVIAAVSHPQAGPLAVLLSWRPLRAVGLISYGMYLYHWPIIVWLNRDRTGLDGWELIAVQLAVTLVISAASFVLVERPIRHRRIWPVRAAVMTPLAGFVGCAAIVFVSTAGYLPLDAPRVPASQAVPLPSANGARIMVVGDSVADFIAAEGIVYLRADPQPTVLNLAVQGCSEPPTSQFRYPDGTISHDFAIHCDNGWDNRARTFKPDFVVYGTVGAAAAELDHDGQWLAPCSVGYRDWVAARIAELATRFGRSGATLVVLTTVPEDRRSRTAADYQAYLDGNACWNAALRNAVKVAPTKVKLVDLAREFCTDDRACLLHTADGSAAREDGAHYRGRAAQIIGKIILGRLGIAASLPG